MNDDFLRVDEHYLNSYQTSKESDIIKENKTEDRRQDKQKEINNYDFKYSLRQRIQTEFFYSFFDVNFLSKLKEKYKDKNEMLKQFKSILKQIQDNKINYKGLEFTELRDEDDFNFGSYWNIKINTNDFYNFLLTEDKKYNNSKFKDGLIKDLSNNLKNENLFIYDEDDKGNIKSYFVTPFSLSVIKREQIKNSKGLLNDTPTELEIKIEPIFFKYFLKFDRFFDILPTRKVFYIFDKYIKDFEREQIFINHLTFYDYYLYFLTHNNNKGSFITFDFKEFAKAKGGRYYHHKTTDTTRIKTELKEFLKLCIFLNNKNIQIYKGFKLIGIEEENDEQTRIKVKREIKAVSNINYKPKKRKTTKSSTKTTK